MIKYIKASVLIGLAFILTALISVGGLTDQSQQKEWISIFNGKNLDGWTPKFTGHKLGINYKNTFRVEDGLLKASYDNYKSFEGKFGHLFYRQPYSNYKIRLEYRFVGNQVPGAPEWAYRNSGIKFHCQPPESMGKDQMSPVSIEVQLLGGNGKDPRPTANICSMGTHIVMNDSLITQHCSQSTSETYHGDQWVKVEAEIHGGDVITHKVNGRTFLLQTPV